MFLICPSQAYSNLKDGIPFQTINMIGYYNKSVNITIVCTNRLCFSYGNIRKEDISIWTVKDNDVSIWTVKGKETSNLNMDHNSNLSPLNTEPGLKNS